MRTPLAALLAIASLFFAASHAFAAPDADEKVYAIKEVDTKPTVRGTRQGPVYPRRLEEDRITGQAIIKFVVDTDGKVTNVSVVRATHEFFGDAGMDAVKKWKFKPAKKDGRPVKCVIHVPFHFNLD